MIVMEFFPAVLLNLDGLQDQNLKVYAKASVLLNRIAKSSFVVACLVVKKYSGQIIMPLTKILWKKDLNMFSPS